MISVLEFFELAKQLDLRPWRAELSVVNRGNLPPQCQAVLKCGTQTFFGVSETELGAVDECLGRTKMGMGV